MKNKIERRNFKTEVRAVKTGDAPARIEGYASTFNEPYVVSDWFGEIVEQIAPGAFTRAIQEKQDVRCLFNHDPNHVLGRTKSNTLTLSEDSKGLAYSCEPPEGVHVVNSIERGDIDGSSFGFIVLKDHWDDEMDEKGRIIKSTRTIMDVDLFDVGPVTYPANGNATAAIRSLFPQGMPAEFRSRLKPEARNTHCKCTCDECAAGSCAECSNPDCTDPNCEGEVDEQAERTRKPGHKHQQRNSKCACDCTECKGGNCDECTDEGCDDENCRCLSRSLQGLPRELRELVRNSFAEMREAVKTFAETLKKLGVESRADAKTKKVDGVELTSDCFAYVGDPDNRSSWKLPIKFPDDEKTKTHVGKALERFKSTKGIPEAQRDAVYQKIVAAAKEHDIEVSEENSVSQEGVELRKRRLRQIELSLEPKG